MPRMSTAELTGPNAFPQQLGEPLWQERRTMPVELFAGVLVAFLATATVTVGSSGLRVLLAVATVAGVVVLFRLRRRGLIETFTVTERFIAIEQASGGRVAIRTEALTSVRLEGDAVRIESPAGVLTFGFVRRQKSLVRTLGRVAPAVQVTRRIDLSCPT